MGFFRSIRFDIGGTDHPGPLLGLVGDQLLEIGRRACKHRSAQLGKPRLHLRIGESCIDFFIKLVDDVRGRAPRRADAEPGVHFVTRLRSAGLEARPSA